MRIRVSLILLTAALSATSAFAQYVSGFETPPYSSGQVSGQDGWTGDREFGTARVRTDSEIAADLSNFFLSTDAPVHTGSQALMVSSLGLGTTQSNATIRPISGMQNENLVVLDLWTRPLTGASTGNIFLTMEDASSTRAAAFRFGNTGGILTIDYGTTVTGIWQPSGVIWDSNTWYHLTMTVDYSTKTYDFAVDGIQMNSSPIPFYNASSANLSQVRIFRGASQSGMILDDLTIRTVPEPGTFVSICIGAGVMLLRRRRSRKS
jgi:hypothetical protein